MQRILFSITVLVVALSTTHCNNYRQLTTQTEVLFRNDWKLTELQGQAVPDSVKSRFQFTPGKISGTTGCNRLAAGFTPGKNQTIRFSPELLTNIDCTNANAATLETKLLEALSKANNWTMAGGGLTLKDGPTTIVRFAALQ